MASRSLADLCIIIDSDGAERWIDDYQQKFFNFQELLEFAYLFQCEGVSASAIQDILGCSGKTARELQVEVARLEPWQVISRSQERSEGFVKFKAEAFYQSYI